MKSTVINKSQSSTGFPWSKVVGFVVLVLCVLFIARRFYDAPYDSHQLSLIKQHLWSVRGLFILTVVLVLTFFNWLLEAIKWKFLIKNIHPISLVEAYRSVLLGLAFTIITPFRVGSFVGKVWLFPRQAKAQASMASVFGGLAQLFVTVLFGLIALNFNYQAFDFLKGYVVVSSALLLAVVAMVYFYSDQVGWWLKKWVQNNTFYKTIVVLESYSIKEKLHILQYSVVRYVIFMFQYYALLFLFEKNLTFSDLFWPLALVFFVVSVVPSVFFSIGLREASALLVLGGIVGADYAILTASLLLWLVNMILPSIIGALAFMGHKKNKV